MTTQLGIIMDPIRRINVKKDSSFAMLLAAQNRGWSIRYMELEDLWLRDSEPLGRSRQLVVRDDPDDWFSFGEEEDQSLSRFDVILMRKDPPFDMEYIYATYILELAQASGALVVNDPRSLRDANEKLFTAWFPQCCPASLVTRNGDRIRDFLGEQGDIILKPLDGMGGVSIFRLLAGDFNANVTIETLTRHGTQFTMAQRFIPEIDQGDKRILLIDGEPVSYALARIPPPGETRGNLAVGGSSKGVPLTERDRWICEQIGTILRDKGLTFVGIDVIGDYLTEINVTSPTCIRELDAIYDLDIAEQLMQVIERKLEG